MNAPLVVTQLARAVSDPERLAAEATKNPELIAGLLEGLAADTARVRFGCSKALGLLSASRPDLLYPHFDSFVRLLDSKNKVFQWNAAFVLSHLARVDAANRFNALFDKYFSPIAGPVMITAANVIRHAPRLARAKPHWADRIAAEVLKVGRARYDTPECRNVAIGHAMLALGSFLDLLRDPAPVWRFARRQVKNSRPATRKKAAQLLKRATPAREKR